MLHWIFFLKFMFLHYCSIKTPCRWCLLELGAHSVRSPLLVLGYTRIQRFLFPTPPVLSWHVFRGWRVCLDLSHITKCPQLEKLHQLMLIHGHSQLSNCSFDFTLPVQHICILFFLSFLIQSEKSKRLCLVLVTFKTQCFSSWANLLDWVVRAGNGLWDVHANFCTCAWHHHQLVGNFCQSVTSLPTASCLEGCKCLCRVILWLAFCLYPFVDRRFHHAGRQWLAALPHHHGRYGI